MLSNSLSSNTSNLSAPHLVVDLNAIAANWRFLNSCSQPLAIAGAVVKANAYGLGLAQVAPCLLNAGCKHFYVANLEEAIALKSILADAQVDAAGVEISVLSGCARGDEREFVERQILPVLISLEMAERWSDAASAGARAHLKVNSGMGRFGLEGEELESLLQSKNLRSDLGVIALMSHLACADEPEHPLNQQQLSRFSSMLASARKQLPDLQGCLSNSAGVLLGEAYHFQRTRPGIGLYGGNPRPSFPQQLQAVVKLHLPVLQLRNLNAGESVGYGASFVASSPRKLAVLAGGYADGLFRRLTGRAKAWVTDPNSADTGGWFAPVVGRISMDSTVIDITDLPAGVVAPGCAVEMLGANVTLADFARAAETIDYEVLTSLGARYRRVYVE
ncbi:alanine racemase [Teredinibacter waterburyi]|jgi:alanine racemase|uniref:alanine racemase n=1 Tax=Teredinibacter waterburyi TaxID=1500538 RepID=UPI00165F57B5|nr:alanine racemase [Teredinibacter waterburyi]